jgi:hypothetical protein
VNAFSNIFNNLRVWVHIAFWGFLTLLFLQQNPDAELQEYLAWLTVLGISATVVYTNLYFLFPNLPYS